MHPHPPPPPAVGGIYQVIRSKCGASVEELGDQYVLLGPYKEASVHMEVEVQDFDASSPIMDAVTALRNIGWKVLEGFRFYRLNEY